MDAVNYFDSWNFQNNIDIALPELYKSQYAKQRSNNSVTELECRFFDQETELDEMKNNSTLLFGRNFDGNRLSQCSTVKESRDVVNMLTNNIDEQTEYLVVEINSGITGLNLELMSRDRFARMICYCADKESKNMLGRNVNAFGMGNKCILEDEFFGGVIKNGVKGCIVVINNPPKHDKVAYITTTYDISVGDFVEINRKNVYVFVIRSDRELSIGGFTSFYVEGYTILINRDPKILPTANSGGLTYFTDHNVRDLITSKLSVDPYTTSVYQTVPNTKVKSPDSTKLDLSWASYPDSERLEVMVDVLSKHKPPESRGKKEWGSGYRKMLYDFLRILTQGDETLDDIIKAMLSPSNMMMYWIPAVVHESVDAEFNYEQLETLGDVYLDGGFFTYLKSKYPKITPNEFDSITSLFLSTQHLAKFCRNLFLDKWILSRFTLEEHIEEDVFEAFVGALYLSADAVQPGLGPNLTLKLVNLVFSKTDVMYNDVGIGNKITVVSQYNIGNNMDLYTESENVKNGVHYHNLKLTPEAVNFFKKNGLTSRKLNVKTTITGSGSGKKGAKANAFQNMYNFLKDNEVTYEWMTNYNDNRKLTSYPDNKKLFNLANNKSLREGYVKIFTKRHDKADTYTGYILIGVLPNGKKVQLATVEMKKTFQTNTNDREAIATGLLLKEYLK